MKKQKISAIVLAGAMILGMTGCGNSKASAYKKYVTLGQYKGIEYTKTVQEVTDEEVESELEQFVENLKEKTEVTDRAVEKGDIVNIDYVGTKDGVAFDGGSAEGSDLTIGSGSFIDGFEDGLIGHNIGEEVSLDLTFPDNYGNTDLAGADVNFMVTINSIAIETIPELTDDLVKENTDYDTIEAYKEYIANDLKESYESSADSQARSDVFNKVIENATVSGYDEDETKKLVDEEFEQFKQTAESYEAYGYSYEDVLSMNGYDTEDALKEGITEYIKNYLTQKMVLYCVADKEGIKVTDQEVQDRVKETMDMYGIETEDQLYEYFGEDYFELSLLSEKVMDFLMENAVLVDSTEEGTISEEENTSEEEETSEEENVSEEEDASEEENASEEDATEAE